MKRMLKCLLLILLIIPINKSFALSVSNNNLTIEKGGNNSVELYANVDEDIISVAFTLVYSTYDIPASFAVASGCTDTNPNGINHEVIFDEAKNGKVLLGTINISVVNYPNDTVGTVNMYSATAKTSDGQTITLDNQAINIRVGTPKTEENALLDKIESKIVDIELKEDVFEYTVNINEDVEELDLEGIAKDKDAKVETTTQKIKDLEDNKIIITVKNGSKEQKYIIKVNVKEKNETSLIIDTDKFIENKGYKGKWIIITIVLIAGLMVSLLLYKKK